MYTVAIAGVTGAVGQEMLSILEERDFPVDELVPLASRRSKGQEISFRDESLEVEVLGERSFEDVDIALFSAGSGVVKEEADRILEQGAVIVDNSSAFRYDPEIPLVVPEINAHALKDHDGLIANPNCSTTQLVMVLAPLHEKFDIKRIVVSTYQATTGAGSKAKEDMWTQIEAEVNDKNPPESDQFPHPISSDALPEIGPILDDHNQYTKEEMKMVWETRKILEDDALEVSPTAVRIPVPRGHGESVNLEFNKSVDMDEVRDLLSSFPGVEVQDDPHQSIYPTMRSSAGKDPVYVGRIRLDPSVNSGMNCWIVADNLRKGAALNTIQIAEELIENNLVHVRQVATASH